MVFEIFTIFRCEVYNILNCMSVRFPAVISIDFSLSKTAGISSACGICLFSLPVSENGEKGREFSYSVIFQSNKGLIYLNTFVVI